MKTICAIWVVLLAVVTTTSWAQITARSEVVYAEVGGYSEFGYRNSYLSTINAGYVFFHRPRIWLAGEGNVFKFWNADYSTLGVGIRPSVRFYPIRQPKIGAYIEVKGGPIYMFPEYAREAINYTLLASVGGEVKLSASNALYFGVGYTHYSNGKRWGDARNPTWDGMGGQTGIIHVLR